MRVLNKYRDTIPPDAINIMRPSILGNPWPIGIWTRDEVCDKFEPYARIRLIRDAEFKQAIYDLWGHDVVCCCKPKRCHGDTCIMLCEELHGTR